MKKESDTLLNQPSIGKLISTGIDYLISGIYDTSYPLNKHNLIESIKSSTPKNHYLIPSS